MKIVAKWFSNTGSHGGNGG